MGHEFKPRQVPSFRQTYVVFSPTKGVFLGDGNWSQTNPEGKDKAPVFCHTDGIDVLQNMVEAGVTDVSLKECWPDRYDGKTASKNMCAAAGLPGW